MGATATVAAYWLWPLQTRHVAELPDRIPSQIAAAGDTRDRLMGRVKLGLASMLAMLRSEQVVDALVA